MAHNEVGKYYDKKYQSYGETKIKLSPWHLETITVVRKEIPENSEIFEIGSGNGVLLDALKESGYNVTGLEASENAADQCEKKGHKIVRGNIESGLPDDLSSKYDAVVSTEVIEHIFDYFFFLKECNRLAKDDGILVLTTPEFFSLRNMRKIILGKTPTEIDNPTHIRFFSRKFLGNILRSQGFEVVSSYGISGNLFGLAGIFQKIGMGWLVRLIYRPLGRTSIYICKKTSKPKYENIIGFIAEYHKSHYES